MAEKTLELKTGNGTLTAEIETRTMCGHDAIYISFTNKEGNIIDVACVRVNTEETGLELMLWDDVSTEDPSYRSTLRFDEIDAAVNIEA